MKHIFFFLSVSVVAASLGIWYLRDPGSVTITWLDYEIQFSVISAFVFFTLLLIIIFIILRLFHRLHSFVSHCLSFFHRSRVKEETIPSSVNI